MRWTMRTMCAPIAAVLLALSPSVTLAQLCGDADGDGTVGINDGVQTLRSAAFLSSTCSANVCDVTGDGDVNLVDGINVLRAAASLSSQHVCPSEVTGFVNGVEGSDGTDSSLDIGVAPVPGAGAPETINDVEGDTNVEGGESNSVTVTYDTGAGAGAGIAGAAGEQSLIVGVRTLRGIPRRGFFKLPLTTPSGQITVIITFPPNLPDEDFLLGFATLDADGVGQVVTLRQHPGPTPIPTPTPRPTSTPSCGDGTITRPRRAIRRARLQAHRPVGRIVRSVAMGSATARSSVTATRPTTAEGCVVWGTVRATRSARVLVPAPRRRIPLTDTASRWYHRAWVDSRHASAASDPREADNDSFIHADLSHGYRMCVCARSDTGVGAGLRRPRHEWHRHRERRRSGVTRRR